MSWTAYLSAFGFGGLVSVLFSQWLRSRAEQSARSFTEKREAYYGFIETIDGIEREAYSSGYRSSIEAHEAELAKWYLRLYLVGSPEVCRLARCLAGFKEGEYDEYNETRLQAYADLVTVMRKDLASDKRHAAKFERLNWM